MTNEAGTCKDWPISMPGHRALPRYGSMAVRKALARALNQIRRVSNVVLTAQSSRRMKVVETVSLGEKRFVSILHIDGEEFLLGGSASSVAVLAKLDRGVAAAEPFGSVLAREKQIAPQTNDCSEQTSESTR